LGHSSEKSRYALGHIHWMIQADPASEPIYVSACTLHDNEIGKIIGYEMGHRYAGTNEWGQHHMIPRPVVEDDWESVGYIPRSENLQRAGSEEHSRTLDAYELGSARDERTYREVMMGSPVERMVHGPVHAAPPRTEPVIDVDLEQPEEQPTLAPTVEELVHMADVDPPMEEPDSAMDEDDEPDEEE
jgi:hypothetical protein